MKDLLLNKGQKFLVLNGGKKERFYQGQKGVFDSPIEVFLSAIFDIDSKRTAT